MQSKPGDNQKKWLQEREKRQNQIRQGNSSKDILGNIDKASADSEKFKKEQERLNVIYYKLPAEKREKIKQKAMELMKKDGYTDKSNRNVMELVYKNVYKLKAIRLFIGEINE